MPDVYTTNLQALAQGYQEGINALTDSIQAEHDQLRVLRDEIKRAEERLQAAITERAQVAGDLMQINAIIENRMDIAQHDERAKVTKGLRKLITADWEQDNA